MTRNSHTMIERSAARKLLAALFGLGMIAFTGLATAQAAHAEYTFAKDRTTVTGNQAG